MVTDGLGQKIREHRRNLHLTLEQVAKASGLSKGFLSQLERGVAQPSISSLKKISRALKVSLVDLVAQSPEPGSTNGQVSIALPAEPHQHPYSETVKVVQANRRKRIVLPGSTLTYDLLTPDLNRQLEVLYLHAKPGDDSGPDAIVDPPGEKFGIVFRGELEVTVGEDVYHLGTGDTICFPCNYAHSWEVVGNKDVELMWVMTPPAF